MRTIVLTAALALVAASAGAASARQHGDRGGARPGSPAPAATSPAPAAAQARPASAAQGEPEILLYGAKDYAGPAHRITGAFPDTSLGGVNSVRVNGQTWRLCSGANYTGACVNVSQSVPAFAAYFGPPVIRSLKRNDEPRAPAPPVATHAGDGVQARDSRGSGGQDRQDGAQARDSRGSGGQDRQDGAANDRGGWARPGQAWNDRGGRDNQAWSGSVRRVSYACQRGVRLTATFDDRRGWVQIQADRQAPLTLRQTPARSGFLYQDANRSFFGVGDRATYTVGDNYRLRCRVEASTY